MGHTIVGDLPRTKRWNQVVALLQAPTVDPGQVAGATVLAATSRLVHLRGDPSLTYCFWLLTRLAAAARGPDFATDTRHLGLDVTGHDHALALVAQINERAREELRRFPESGPFGDIAVNALRTALTETLGAQNLSLFGSSVDDLAAVFRRHSSASQFGELATRFFGAVTAQTLRYYVDRALPAAISPDGGLRSLADLSTFQAALERHARESARIVELFAAQWWLKSQRAKGAPLNREEVQSFTAHALTKLRKELERATT
jgi:hypothetical protein